MAIESDTTSEAVEKSRQTRRGSCQCGAIHYVLHDEPLLIYACHCNECQTRTGSAFSMGLIVLLENIQLSGKLCDWQRQSDAGQSNIRHSCASCGNAIYGLGNNMPGLAKLQAGTLHDKSQLRPNVHIWTRSKQSWFNLPDDANCYETQPDDLAKLLLHRTPA